MIATAASFAFGIFRALPKGVASLLSAAAAGAAVFAAMNAFDALIDDPAVRRQARQAYVAIAEFEGEKAKRESAEQLLALAQEKSAQLENLRRSDAAALAAFDAARKEAERETIEVRDELLGEAPAVGALGVLGRLRNR